MNLECVDIICIYFVFTINAVRHEICAITGNMRVETKKDQRTTLIQIC